MYLDPWTMDERLLASESFNRKFHFRNPRSIIIEIANKLKKATNLDSQSVNLRICLGLNSKIEAYSLQRAARIPFLVVLYFKRNCEIFVGIVQCTGQSRSDNKSEYWQISVRKFVRSSNSKILHEPSAELYKHQFFKVHIKHVTAHEKKTRSLAS